MTERLNELKKKYHEAVQGLEDTLFTRIQARLAATVSVVSASEDVKEEIKETDRAKVSAAMAHRVHRGEFRITQSEATAEEAKQQGRNRWKRWLYSVVVVFVLIVVATLGWFF